MPLLAVDALARVFQERSLVKLKHSQNLPS